MRAFVTDIHTRDEHIVHGVPAMSRMDGRLATGPIRRPSDPSYVKGKIYNFAVSKLAGAGMSHRAEQRIIM